MQLTALSRSVAARLIFVSVIASFIGVTLIAFVNIASQLYDASRSESHSFKYLGALYAQELVVRSLGRPESGRVEIRPTPELIRLSEEVPTLKYSVFDLTTGVAIAGSTGEQQMPPRFKNRGAIKVLGLYERTLDDERGVEGSTSMLDTSFGRYIVAVDGALFKWQYPFWDFYNDFIRILPFETPIFILVPAFMWVALKKSLAPLERTVLQAQNIQLKSINQRLPETEVPRELEPLVSAINSLLARLDSGIERERRFSANAAHELRTPIAILTAYVETIQDGAVANELRRHLSQLQSIVEQLLVTARITRSPSQGVEDVDLAATVFAKVSDYTPLIMESVRDIVFEGPTSGVMAKGNVRAIDSVVGNLLDNALRAEPVGGSVLVSVDPGATVSIVDHGEGVPVEDREKIFEPFWRKDENTVGTGLGLSIAKELMEKLGGRIWVEETPGGGATFRLQFPGNLSA